MRAVRIISSQPDLLALVPELEEAGLTASVLNPGDLGDLSDDSSTNALLLDLRDLSVSTVDRLAAASGERDFVTILVCGQAELSRVPFDVPADDFVVLPTAPGLNARSTAVTVSITRTSSVAVVSQLISAIIA